MPDLRANRTPYQEMWVVISAYRLYTYPSFSQAFAAALRFREAVIEQIW